MSDSPELTTAIAAARASGQVLLDWHQRPVTFNHKADRSIVSEADFAAEKTILAIIQTAFPEHAIFSEEAGLDQKKNPWTWVIDPLDGTTNFVHHLARFCTSIGLYHDGQPYLGVVYDPIEDELFAAQTGQGATLNGAPISASDCSELSDAIISIGRGSSQASKEKFGIVLATHLRVRTLRILGATALASCYTACGRFSAHIGAQTQAHDGAAAAVIAKEAGAVVTNFVGQPWGPPVGTAADMLITNRALHADFVELLKDIG